MLSSRDTRARNRQLFAGPFGALYSFYMERQRVSRIVARVVWGADIAPFYASMRAIETVRPNGLVVDMPCGAGVAFRGLRPDQDIRYLAADLSEAMLHRARRRARDLRLAQVRFGQAEATDVPVADASVDLFLSYFGLHCFPDPAAAVREIARCLRPGGRLVGGTIVGGRSRRQRLIVRPGRSAFGPVGTVEQLGGWLERAGIADLAMECDGAIAYFSGARADRA
jgi:SAM-dependent methyltransferase